MSYPTGAQWVTVRQFTGFNTKIDPSKIDIGANPNGQNSSINDGDRISTRPLGYDLYPTTATYSTTPEPGKSLHTFRKRDGTNLLMWSHGSVIEVFDEVSQTWFILGSGYSSADFGFADYNINTDLHSYVYFGNAVDDFSRWNGSIVNLTAPLVGGEQTINVTDTSGFKAANDTIIIGGTVYTYDVLNANSFHITVPFVGTALDNAPVAQGVETDNSNPKGNIYLVANNRIFIAGVTATPQAVFFSKYGDAMTYLSTLVTSSTATAAGIFNLGEGGGGVTGMAMDEQSIYIMKKSITYKATLSDSFYSLDALKPYDGKSQTTGSVQRRSTFSGDNGIFVLTADNQIMNLTRLATLDYPQILPISDPILPTVSEFGFDASTGIVFQDRAFIAVKSTIDSTVNDTVLVYNYIKSFWESPIVGWNVGDWTVYDNGDGEELYFADAVSPNVFRVTTTPVDYIYDVNTSWRSKQYDFDLYAEQKLLSAVYVEGYITDNTTLNISLLLDENGVTASYTTNFKGTETQYLFAAPIFNLFALLPFATERFGSNADQTGKKKFRVYLNKGVREIPFYNCQIVFESSGKNQNWEVTQYGFLVRKDTQPIRTILQRVFKNI